MWNDTPIERYTERQFQASGRTEWPEVRQVARALRIRQAEVERQIEANDNLCLSYYNTTWEPPLGDYYVEVYDPPEAAGA